MFLTYILYTILGKMSREKRKIFGKSHVSKINKRYGQWVEAAAATEKQIEAYKTYSWLVNEPQMVDLTICGYFALASDANFFAIFYLAIADIAPTLLVQGLCLSRHQVSFP